MRQSPGRRRGNRGSNPIGEKQRWMFLPLGYESDRLTMRYCRRARVAKLADALDLGCVRPGAANPRPILISRGIETLSVRVILDPVGPSMMPTGTLTGTLWSLRDGLPHVARSLGSYRAAQRKAMRPTLLDPPTIRQRCIANERALSVGLVHRLSTDQRWP